MSKGYLETITVERKILIKIEKMDKAEELEMTKNSILERKSRNHIKENNILEKLR